MNILPLLPARKSTSQVSSFAPTPSKMPFLAWKCSHSMRCNWSDHAYNQLSPKTNCDKVASATGPFDGFHLVLLPQKSELKFGTNVPSAACVSPHTLPLAHLLPHRNVSPRRILHKWKYVCVRQCVPEIGSARSLIRFRFLNTGVQL